jgi:mannose-6-phosphate isomerase-like protein (cupin superfamily)
MLSTATKIRPSLDVLSEARSNNAFRRVIETGEHQQVVLMTIPVGGDIGEEVHFKIDQAFIFVDGRGEAVLDGELQGFDEGDLVFVRAGTEHNIINRGRTPLRLITIYAPPAHGADTVHLTKADAERDEP